MKVLKQLVIGGVIGAGIAIVVIISPFIHFSTIVNELLIGLLIFIALLWLIGLILLQKTKRLSKLDVTGDEEDEIEAKKYTISSDFMLLFQASTFISLFVTSISIIEANSVVLIFLGIGSIIASYVFIVVSLNQVKSLYSEREIPNAMDPEYPDKLLQMADEGERHVILQGLYKTFGLFNIAIVLGIIAATMYSMFVDQSQFFSIALMCIILLIVNGGYYTTIRKKV